MLKSTHFHPETRSNIGILRLVTFEPRHGILVNESIEQSNVGSSAGTLGKECAIKIASKIMLRQSKPIMSKNASRNLLFRMVSRRCQSA